MAVNRCICNNVPFAAALVLARHSGVTTVAGLQRLSPLGTGCGLCVPYMQRSLMTGETDLPVLPDREAASLRALSGVGSAEEVSR
jgi:bacterioferritin-associated ferredoxin